MTNLKMTFVDPADRQKAINACEGLAAWNIQDANTLYVSAPNATKYLAILKKLYGVKMTMEVR